MNIPFPITIDIFSNYDKIQLKHDPYLRSHFNPPSPPPWIQNDQISCKPLLSSHLNLYIFVTCVTAHQTLCRLWSYRMILPPPNKTTPRKFQHVLKIDGIPTPYCYMFITFLKIWCSKYLKFMTPRSWFYPHFPRNRTWKNILI